MSGTIGAKIRERRTGLNMSQAQLAEEIGVAKQTVHRWEAGKTKVSAKQLAKIAQVLETTASDLCLESPAPEVRFPAALVGALDQPAVTELNPARLMRDVCVAAVLNVQAHPCRADSFPAYCLPEANCTICNLNRALDRLLPETRASREISRVFVHTPAPKQ